MRRFNASRHCWRHPQSLVSFAEIVIREIQRDRSLKVFKLFAECVRETSQTAAVHPKRVILLFNVARRNPAHGDQEFFGCTSLTSITIPNTVTSLGNSVFYECTSLTSVTIPNSVTNMGDSEFDQCHLLTGVTLSNSITNIGLDTFEDCYDLTNIVIPNSVTSIGTNAFLYCTSLTNIENDAFYGCTSLKNIYFAGNAPTPNNDTNVFLNDINATVYYMPKTIGWGPTFDGLPTVLWNPQAQKDASFGVQNNQFGFNITGSSNLVVVVEACTNLANPVWSPVSTNTLNTFIGTNGTSYFRDPQWTNYPSRFYGFSWP
jgi:hypothetical protein